MTNSMNVYNVYVRINSDGYITAVNSSAFLTDTEGWIEIDSGHSSKYAHAQTSYFPQTIFTDTDVYRYKLVDGKAMKCTADEIADQVRKVPLTGKSLEERVNILESSASETKRLLTIMLGDMIQL